MKRLQKFQHFGRVSEEMSYHLNSGSGILENVFRYGSSKYMSIIQEARILMEAGEVDLSDEDMHLLMTTDIGKKAKLDGEDVWLDLPMHDEDWDDEDWDDEEVDEAEYRGRKVKLGKPMRTRGSKPYKVYVKDPDTGNVIVVRFGSGMRARIDDEEARAEYDSRHGCSAGKHEDKTKPGYWSCRLPRYAKQLGMAGGGRWW